MQGAKDLSLVRHSKKKKKWMGRWEGGRKQGIIQYYPQNIPNPKKHQSWGTGAPGAPLPPRPGLWKPWRKRVSKYWPGHELALGGGSRGKKASVGVAGAWWLKCLGRKTEGAEGPGAESRPEQRMDFPGGPVVKSTPANAEDTGLIPGPGRFHTLRGN